MIWDLETIGKTRRLHRFRGPIGPPIRGLLFPERTIGSSSSAGRWPLAHVANCECRDIDLPGLLAGWVMRSAGLDPGPEAPGDLLGAKYLIQYRHNCSKWVSTAATRPRARRLRPCVPSTVAL
jgi:hypothetical protein